MTTKRRRGTEASREAQGTQGCEDAREASKQAESESLENKTKPQPQKAMGTNFQVTFVTKHTQTSPPENQPQNKRFPLLFPPARNSRKHNRHILRTPPSTLGCSKNSLNAYDKQCVTMKEIPTAYTHKGGRKNYGNPNSKAKTTLSRLCRAYLLKAYIYTGIAVI